MSDGAPGRTRLGANFWPLMARPTRPAKHNRYIHDSRYSNQRTVSAWHTVGNNGIMHARRHPRAILSWSSGKDSAYALSMLLQSERFDVVALVTTIEQATRRVPVHAVGEQLLDRQAEALRLPLWKIEIPWPCPDSLYRAAITKLAQRAVEAGISHLAFGDLFLEDIRAFREDLLRGTDVEPIFPLWGLDTGDLARRMITAGIRSTITCVDRTQLEGHFAGTQFDRAFLDQLPPGVDPCGENGEFHTCVWDGPGFRTPLPMRVEEIVEDDRFTYAEVRCAERAMSE